MSNLLSIYTNSRDNNFNLIRFIASSLVLFSHSFALSLGSGDFEPLRSTIGMTWGMIAVDIFFVTSGFLITSSYFSRNNLIAFVWARILRIYPALIIAVIVCVFIIGAWFTTNSIQEYLSNPQTQKYFIKNTTLFWGIEYSLPGVFLDVPYKGAVNGSLWTLPYEVKMYAILAFTLGLTAYISKRIKILTVENVILFIGVFSATLHIFNYFYTILPVNFIRLFSMFFIGAAFFAWKEKIRLSSKWALLGVALLLLSAMNRELFFISYCLLLPYLIFYAAYVPSGYIRKFNEYGDYSYGIYIYAFPIQQSAAVLIPNISVPAMVIVSFVATLFLAMLSWHLIEKRFLKMKGAYIVIEDFIQKNGLTRLISRRAKSARR